MTMTDLTTYEKLLQDSPDLNKVVSDLLQFVLDKKTFNILKADFTIDPLLLIQNNILSEIDTHYRIAPSAIFYSKLYSHFAGSLSFTLDSNVPKAFAFIDQVEAFFESAHGVNAGIYDAIRNLSQFVLFHMHKVTGTDFNTFILSLTKDSAQILYDFNTAYCKIIPLLTYSPETLFQNCSHLLQILTSDARYDSNTGAIGLALKQFATNNPAVAEKMLAHSLVNHPPNHRINIPVIGALYELGGSNYWNNILELYKDPKNYVALICALAFCPATDNEVAQKEYDLISKISSTDIEVLINLPKFYVSLIKNPSVTSVDLKDQCFERLAELIVSDKEVVRHNVLWEVSYWENYEVKKVELFKKFLLSANFDKKQVPDIGRAFYGHKDLSSFTDFLKALAIKIKMGFNPDDFASPIYHFHQNDAVEFSKALVTLITDNLPEIRFVGNKIIDYLRNHRNKFTFACNILEFGALTQYKLWMSVMGDLKQPKETLPMLFPLLNSQFPIVQEAFIGMVEQLTEEYSSAVLDTIKQHLDQNIHENKAFHDRVKAYMDVFQANLPAKHALKEFDPIYTQSRLHRLYYENHDKKFNKEFGEGVNKGSTFLSMIKTVILAKGGGWKPEGSDKVSKLGSIGISFQLPRSMFLRPDAFDWEFRVHLSENWENKFEEWEAIIAS